MSNPVNQTDMIGEPQESLIGALCAAAAAGRIVDQHLRPYPADEAAMRMCFARFLGHPRTRSFVVARLAAGDTICLADPVTLAEEGISLHAGDRLHLNGATDIRLSSISSSEPFQCDIGDRPPSAEGEVIQLDAAASIHLILADGRSVYPITSDGELLAFRACDGKTRLHVMTRLPQPQLDASGRGQWWGH